MKIRNEKSIATIYDAVSILKGLDIINGSLKQNYYAESALFVPDRFINPLILRPKIDISDPSGSIPNGDKVDELSRLEWFENGVKINSNDDFKIEGANLTVFKNSEEPFEISYRAEWFDSRKKQVITIEDSVIVSCISLAQSDANVTMSLSKPQNWVHNPLKGERIYTINAYVSKDKVHESAVEWYYVDSNKKDKLIDSSCSFYVEGQYTNVLKVDSAYMDNVIIKAKNISNDKLKEVYWFFDKHGNPLTYAMPDKTIIEGKDVFSLPESPITSKLDYRINGLTIEQLVKNGDFSDGKKGWACNGGKDKLSVVLKDGDKWLKCTAGTAKKYIREDKIYNFNKGDIIAVNIEIIGDSSIEDYLYGAFLSTPNDMYPNYPDPIKNMKKKGYGLKTINESGSYYVIFGNNLDGGLDSFYIKSPIIINLTQAFGAGNEPTKEWCDEHIQGYFEGLKSIQTPIRIKSDIGGRNLYTNSDFSKGLDGWYAESLMISIENNVLKVVGGGSTSSRFYKINTEPIGTTLTLSFEVKSDTDAILNIGQGVGSNSVASLNITNRNWVKKVFTTDVISTSVLYSYTIMTPDSTLYFRNFKLEKGNKATDWTPAPEDHLPPTGSALYIKNQLELKSIGEVSDYIENGVLYRYIQRLEGINKLKWRYNRQLNNGLHRYTAKLPFTFRSDGLDLTQIYCNNFPVNPSIASLNDDADFGFCVYWQNRDYIILTLEDKVENPNSIIPEDTFIDFLLPETEVVNLSTSGNLITYPNGTIFIDNAIQLEEQYQDGITIKEDYPIQVLESIKVGTEYLDTSKAVVKDNLITHPDIANGDNVTIEYIYDENPIRNTNSIAYLVLEDILDEFWLDNVYTYKITDGEWELVKVTDIEDYEEWLKTEKTSPYTLAPDGVIFGSYEAETKFIRQYPSSLYVDIIAPTRLKEGITQIKARALVGTADGVIENPSKYFDISWYKKSNKAGASDVIIGEGEELTIDVADVDRIGIEVESKTIKE